ncbi:MAG: HNH endonuclease [Hyphomonas sp.]|nr:HNH endonuclease [Hyphomonas sp.]
MFAEGNRGRKATAATWNTRYAEKEAFTAIRAQGYKFGMLLNAQYQAHQIVWAMYYGAWPVGSVDHINQDKCCNLPSNLRDVPHAVNMRNQSLRATNRSGVTGVRWSDYHSKYVAQIRSLGRSIHLGYFTSKDEAIAARKAAERKFGFHRNHGRRRRPS